MNKQNKRLRKSDRHDKNEGKTGTLQRIYEVTPNIEPMDTLLDNNMVSVWEKHYGSLKRKHELQKLKKKKRKGIKRK